MRYIFIAIAIIFMGCSGTQKSIDEYTILANSYISNDTKKATKSLSVATIKTTPSLMSKDLIYLYSSGEVGSYAYSRWSDSPTMMLERILMQKLQQSQIYSYITPSASISSADYILESNLDRFSHLIEGKNSFGVIKIELRVIDISQKRVISQKEFDIKIPSKSIDAKGAIEALQRGSNELGDEIIEWLKDINE